MVCSAGVRRAGRGSGVAAAVGLGLELPGQGGQEAGLELGLREIKPGVRSGWR